MLLSCSPLPTRRFACEDSFHPFPDSDHDDSDEVLDHAYDPSRGPPEFVIGVFAHLAGAADKALGFGWLLLGLLG